MADTPAMTPEREALLQGLAQQAAAWWRNQVASPGHLSHFNNGDTSRAGEMAQIMASMAALQAPGPTSNRLDQFERELALALWEQMRQDPSPSRPSYSGPARDLTLSVDYAPEGPLRLAATSAGVSGFPWKTVMWVSWDADPAKCYSYVRCGYGAPTQRLPPPLRAATTNA